MIDNTGKPINLFLGSLQTTVLLNIIKFSPYSKISAQYLKETKQTVTLFVLRMKSKHGIFNAVYYKS